MGARHVQYAFEQDQSRSVEKLVLLVLANYSNEHGLFWPTLADIQKMTGLSRRIVCKHRQSLKEKGLIHLTSGLRGSKRRIPVFQIVLPVATRQ